MGVLSTYTGVMSALVRLFSYVFLRIIPGRYASFCYWFFLAYCSGLFKIHQNLSLLEDEPARTMEQQQQQQAGRSKNSKKNKHKKNGGGSVDTSSEAHAVSSVGPAKPSYAAVAAEKAHPSTDISGPVGADGSSTSNGELLNGSDGKATRRPPNAHLARDLGIPSRPNPLHLFLGLPSNSRFFNYVSLAINALLILLCLDFQFTPRFFLHANDTTFVRVGAISDTEVKLVARVPPSLLPPLTHDAKDDAPPKSSPHVLDHTRPVTTESVGDELAAAGGSVLDSIIAATSNTHLSSSQSATNSAKIVYRPTRSGGAWQYAGSLPANPESDYVSSLTLRNLLPSTQYEYALVLPAEHKGKFITPNVDHPQFFRTWPDPRLAVHQTHFTFAASSCIKQNFPYVPGQDHFAIKGATELADRIRPDNIDFLMFMGDFIYADVPWKTRTAEGYAKLYRQNYASKDYRRIYENIPTFHIYDDHEIVNDYAGQGNDSSPMFQMAEPAYQAYLGQGNPDPSVPGVNYYTMRYGDAAFFVWDTRRYRSANEAIDDEEKTMLGSTQKRVFLDWLAQVNNTATFKFVVSSIPFQTCYGGPNGQFDTWGGFQHEREELMDVMQYVPNVIVLSGDRHEYSLVSIRESVLDFCIGPLNQFSLPIRTLAPKSGKCATGEDRILKYIPDGYRKFSTFEVDTRTANMPVVSMKLWVDGKEAHKIDIIGKPVHPPASAVTQIGRSLAFSLSELLGLGRGWF